MQTRILSKNKQKLIRQLSQKKYRDALGLFLAEGPKVVSELMGRFPCRLLVCTAEWLSAHPHAEADEVAEVSLEGLQQASLLKTPRSVLAVFARRPAPPAEGLAEIPRRSLTLALDGVQDPGNVGTVIRTAAALGFDTVILCGACADVYSPKTARATMGAIFRENIVRMDITAAAEYIHSRGMKLYGAALSERAADIRAAELQNAVVAIGSEGRGLSAELLSLCDGEVIIPMTPGSESFNAAIAAAIVMWEIVR